MLFLAHVSFAFAAAFGFAIATALAFKEINRNAALLLLPYIGFLAFANALNYSVAKLNPGDHQALVCRTCMQVPCLACDDAVGQGWL